NRLLNMGIEPFLVASAVNCIVAQRLARRICAECVADDPEVESQQLLDAGLSEEDVKSFTPRKGQGCSNCSDTGFKGRVAIYEVMVMTDQLKEFVLNGASGTEIKREAIRGGMVTLRRSALNMMLQGVTTISEVFRVSTSDAN
ncbi:MAG: type II secretion system protein GspE, partial [Myxococcales bacterium]